MRSCPATWLRTEASIAQLAACVRIANAISHELGMGFEPERAPQESIHSSDLAILQLDDPAVAEPLLEDIKASMETAVAALSSLAT